MMKESDSFLSIIIMGGFLARSILADMKNAPFLLFSLSANFHFGTKKVLREKEDFDARNFNDIVLQRLITLS